MQLLGALIMLWSSAITVKRWPGGDRAALDIAHNVPACSDVPLKVAENAIAQRLPLAVAWLRGSRDPTRDQSWTSLRHGSRAMHGARDARGCHAAHSLFLSEWLARSKLTIGLQLHFRDDRPSALPHIAIPKNCARWIGLRAEAARLHERRAETHRKVFKEGLAQRRKSSSRPLNDGDRSRERRVIDRFRQ